MKMVYIAGPYGDAGGYLAIDRNIAKAREAAAFCVEHRAGYYCPHLNSAHFEAIVPAVPVDFWYGMDLAFMPMCDALLVLPGYETSRGTLAEMEEWRQTGKPIFHWQHDFGATLAKWIAA
jgi:hypothetical protein